MAQEFTIFAVDDDKAMRTLLQSALSGHFVCELFDSGEACLQRLEEKRPDLFLLDIELPRMTGYEVCRQLKRRPDTAAIPLMFISGHDDPACILAGYEAGGEDYILKPIHIGGLLRKIEVLRQIRQLSPALAPPAAATSDHAALLDFLHTLNLCHSPPDVAAALLHAGEVFALELTIQVRTPEKSLTLSKKGENWPLEVAALNHIREQGPEFRNPHLAAWNFPQLTLLASHPPTDDPERFGQICQHLKIAAESADVRLHALRSSQREQHLQSELRSLAARMQATTAECAQRNEEVRVRGTLEIARLFDAILQELTPLGISNEQEEKLFALIRNFSRDQISLCETGRQFQPALQEILHRLENLAGSTD